MTADALVHQVAALANGDSEYAQGVAADESINSVRDLALQYDASKHTVLGSSLITKDATGVALGLLQQGKVDADDESTAQSAAALLSGADDNFDLSKDRLSTLQKDQGADEQPISLLSTIQRLENIATGPEVVQPLMAAGYTSAAQIASYSARQFADSVTSIPQDVALQVHANAATVALRNELYLASAAPSILHKEVAQVEAVVMTGEESEINLTTLFGDSQSLNTACSHCSSVLSPAAYVVDLLDSIPDPVKEVLRKRRPDIANLELSCANTNTEVPYIDLVIEILEQYLAHDLDASTALDKPFNNTEEDEALGEAAAVEPRHVNTSVADYVATQAMPIGILPFDRGLEQTRSILQSLGTSRPQILSLFGAAGVANERARCADIVGLTETEYEILTRSSFDPSKPVAGSSAHTCWGYDSADAMLRDDIDDALINVQQGFLPRAGYSFDDMTALLQTRFINGDIPQALRDFPNDLAALFLSIDWLNDDLRARWSGRFPDLKLQDADDKTITTFNDQALRLPSKIVMTSSRTTDLEFHLSAQVHFAPSASSVSPENRIGEIYNGFIISKDRQRYLRFSYSGTLLSDTGVGPVQEAYKLSQFSDPGQHFFFALPKRETDAEIPVVAKLEREPDGGNGDLVILQPAPAQYLQRGPRSLTPTTGWCRNPAAEDGEPVPRLLQLRTLSGQPLSRAQWDKLHVFVRLHKKTGWSIRQTDLVLTSFESQVGTPELVASLAAVKEVQQLTGLSLEETVVLISGLSVDGYENLFLRRGVKADEKLFGLSALTGLPLFETRSDILMTSYTNTIAKALSIADSDVVHMLEATGQLSAHLNLASISLLYRHLLIGKTLGISPPEAKSLLPSFGSLKPFASAHSMQKTLIFWKKLLATRSTPAEADLAMTGNLADSDHPVLSPTTVLQTAWEVAQVLREDEARSIAQQDGSPSTQASEVKDASDTEITDVSSSSYTLEHVTAILCKLFANIPNDVISIVLARHPIMIDNSAEKHAWTGYMVPPKTDTYTIKSEKTEDFVHVESVHVPSIDGIESVELVGGEIYRVIGLDPKLVLPDSGLTDVPASWLLPGYLVEEVREALVLLARYEIFFRVSAVDSKDFATILDILPLSSDVDTLSVDTLDELLTYGLIQSNFKSVVSLNKLINKKFDSSEDVANALADVTEWPLATLEKLCDGLVPMTNNNDTTEDEEPPTTITVTVDLLGRLVDQYKLIQRLKAHDATVITSWASPSVSHDTIAEQVRAVAKASVDESTWSSTASSLFQPIRDRYRNALVATCINNHPKMRSADELFEFFLIDVSMGTCLRTSRIKQAISSVQILMQRFLLGLEPLTSETNQSWQKTLQDFLPQWQWKKSYDTWMANRKIFLYPENWLEPSLRDNKSEVFRAAEAALDQPGATIEDILETYVHALVEVANLETVSIYRGPQKDHIVARTRTAPYKFFYRTFDREGPETWSPWEALKVDVPTLDIVRTLRRPDPVSALLLHQTCVLELCHGREDGSFVQDKFKRFPNTPCGSGSYVSPVAIGGKDDRLAIFFPTLTERSYRLDDNTDPNKSRIAYYWEVGMTFSERRGGQWTARQASTETLNTRGSEYKYRTMKDGYTIWSDENFVNTDARRLFMGYGVRTQDEHLMNKGMFLFNTTYSTDSSSVSIEVYLASPAYMENSQPKPQHDSLMLCAIHLGTFMLEDGHCRVSATRQMNLEALDSIDGLRFDRIGAKGSRDVAFDSYGGPYKPNSSDGLDAPAREWMFQGVNIGYGSWIRRVDSMDKMRHCEDHASSYTMDSYLYYEDVPDITPRTATGRLWDNRVAYFTYPKGTDPGKKSTVLPRPLVMSNNTATVLQHMMVDMKHDQLVDYFNEVPADGKYWPKIQQMLSEFPPVLTTSTTDVMQQSLGIAFSNQKWYHEQRTPVALDTWELCVHVPMLLVSSFISSQRLDEALKAVRLVFDPTATDKSRVWRFLPFRRLAGSSQTLEAPDSEDFDEWLRTPFNPFVIARGRHIAYMKWFAYKYIEIMIAMGDVYFRRFTLESINLAIQCYVEAEQLFGPAPQTIMSVGKKGALTFNQLGAEAKPSPSKGVNAFSGPLVYMENLFPFRIAHGYEAKVNEKKMNIFGSSSARVFCIPANPALAALDAKISDRLYKIRHCQDIDGNVRRMALWEPPLDPGALVAAAANGVPIGSIADSLTGVVLPNYRFALLIRKALELCADVRILGGTILGLRERHDAEKLAELRLGQQKTIGQRLIDQRERELDEASKALELIQNNRLAAQRRMEHYLRLLGEDVSLVPKEGEPFNGVPYTISQPSKEDPSMPSSAYEVQEARYSHEAMVLNATAGGFETVSEALNGIPTFTFSVGLFGIGESTSYGGNEISAIPRTVASGLRAGGESKSWQSENAGGNAAQERQVQDRWLQVSLAGFEVVSRDLEMAAQRGRVENARKKLELEQLSLDHEDELDAFYSSGKYGTAELWTWGINSLQKLYYNAFNLALETAMQAERAFNFERGLLDTPDQAKAMIQGGYWNTSYDGLYAAEQLTQSLRRLEREHMSRRAHDFELVRSVSLRQLNAAALTELQKSGDSGSFSIPETFWNMDFPGHLNRRIKSVSVSIPCDAGPYVSIGATLALTENSVRVAGADDPVRLGPPPVSKVAVSSAASDAGVFELSFKDERYMPFEGAGAISTWQLVLNQAQPSFEYETITDVVLHISYTSQQGNSAEGASRVSTFLRTMKTMTKDDTTPQHLTADLRTEWPTAWSDFRGSGTLQLRGLRERLPFFARAMKADVTGIKLMLEAETAASGAEIKVLVNGKSALAKGSTVKLKGGAKELFEPKLSSKVADGLSTTGQERVWTVQVSDADVAKAVVSAKLVIGYTLS